MDSICCICNSSVDGENAAILAMSGYGSPRYICDGCDADLSCATGAKDVSEIKSAIDRISKKMAINNLEDTVVLKAIDEIMTGARERAEKIKAGEYDFSEEETAPEEAEPEEIPEELRETEEDRELDRMEAEKNKKLDKITNIVCLVFIIAALGFLAYKLITTFI